MSETIKGAVIGAIITGVIGIIGTVIATHMAKNQGEQETINQLNSQMANVSGDNNTVTINSVDDLINEYSALTSENKSLVSQNTKYYDELEEAKGKIKEYENNSNSKVQELEQQLNDKPDVQFKNLGLSIAGDIIPINSNESSVIVNNRTYYADEFINSIINSKIVDENISLTIQDDIVYLGKIIKEKSQLLDQWVFDHSYVQTYDNITDSYGKMHTNSLVFKNSSNCYITYNLNREFSFIKFNLFVCDDASNNRIGTLTIKADDEIVYTSPELTKTTEKVEEIDIPIKMCSLLTIEYNSTGGNNCIMSNIEIYN